MNKAIFPVIKARASYATSLCCIAAALVLILSACASDQSTTTTTTTPTASTGNPSGQQPGDFGLAALPGYTISLFHKESVLLGPDSLVVDQGFVYIDYQNTTAKDCTDKFTSTVVQYDMTGKMLKSFTVPGHSDGMRADPSTHLLWVTSCEDGNPKFVTIDPTSGTITPYAFPSPTPHGGGYDDLTFLNGLVFIAASNPTLNSAGVNVFPAIDKMTLSNGKVNLTPVLMGNATATDLIANAKVSLNLVDPDSMTVDSKGQLVLVNQAGSQLVFLQNPGTSQQTVTAVPVGNQLDDTVWATSSQGRLLVADGTTGSTYWITETHFTPGVVFTQAPDDSGVVGFVGVVDLSTGFVTPLVIGFVKATGMLFVPNS